MAKAKTATDEKFEKVDFDLFEALAAIDRKDYGYYDRLTEEQKKKFNPFMLIKWFSYAKGNTDIQLYHTSLANKRANTHMFHEKIQDHPKLQWLMLCSAGLGGGKIFRQWLTQISERITLLKDKASKDDLQKFYSKIYPHVDAETIDEISQLYVDQQRKKMYLAEQYPMLKIEDIQVLNMLVSDAEIEEHKKNCGN